MGNMTKATRSSPAVDSPEFTRKLVDAFKDAVRQAIAQHHANGHAVYVADDDGDICELRPGCAPRKLSQAQIEDLVDKT